MTEAKKPSARIEEIVKAQATLKNIELSGMSHEARLYVDATKQLLDELWDQGRLLIKYN